MNEEMTTSLLHHQIISPFLNHSLVYVLRGGSKGGGVSAVAIQPLVLGMDTYAAPLMQFAHVQFLKFTPHLVSDTSGYTGTGNNHSGFGPMHYRMHLNRSVMLL